jgi:hypothetical protein
MIISHAQKPVATPGSHTEMLRDGQIEIPLIGKCSRKTYNLRNPNYILKGILALLLGRQFKRCRNSGGALLETAKMANATPMGT